MRARPVRTMIADMRGLWLENNALSLRGEIPDPREPGGEALVRVHLAGICNTDLELLHGYYPFCGVPGHEFVGTVESGSSDWAGRRVVGEINASCGECAVCLAGRAHHCPNRTVLGIVGRNGAFAQHLTIPCANLHEVPDCVPDEVAVFTEPLAAAARVPEQVSMGPGSLVAVIGGGKLGFLVAQVLALRGAHTTLASRTLAPLEPLARRGIELLETTELPPRTFDTVVECTGNPRGLELALAAVRPEGTIVLKSTYHGHTGLDLSRVVVDEIRLVGSRCGPFAPALDLLASGRVDVRSLVDRTYPLAEGLDAFRRATEPGVRKVLVDCTR